MPNRPTRLQEKLRERREKEALTRINGQLSGLFTGPGLTADQVPAWLGETVRGFWSMSAEPLDSLSDSSGAEALDSWVEELLRRNAISAHLYVASHLEILPWLECEVPDQGWMSQVREAVDNA